MSKHYKGDSKSKILKCQLPAISDYQPRVNEHFRCAYINIHDHVENTLHENNYIKPLGMFKSAYTLDNNSEKYSYYNIFVIPDKDCDFHMKKAKVSDMLCL